MLGWSRLGTTLEDGWGDCRGVGGVRSRPGFSIAGAMIEDLGSLPVVGWSVVP